MDLQILKIVGQIAGIGGLALGVFVILFREVLRLKILPNLTKKQAYRLLTTILVLVWSIAIAGIVAWVYVERQDLDTSPTARIKAEPESGKIPLIVSFSASGSEEPLSYSWIIDGDTVSEKEHFEYPFTSPGFYRVFLKVSDHEGNFDTDTIEINAESILVEDLSVILMDTYLRLYPSVRAGEMNSHEIERIMSEYQLNPRIEIYPVKQDKESQSEQRREVREKEPDLIIIHQSAFPKRNEEEESIVLRDFIQSMSDDKAKFLIYSRGFYDESFLQPFQNDEALASRIYIHVFEEKRNPFSDNTTCKNFANHIRSILEQIKRERNSEEEAA